MALRDGRWTYETEVHCFRLSAFVLEMKQTDKYVCAARSLEHCLLVSAWSGILRISHEDSFTSNVLWLKHCILKVLFIFL